MSRVATAALAAAILLQATTGVASAQDRFELSGDMVAIYNLAGTVEVVRGSGSNVVVEVTRGGADAGRLTVDVDPIRGRTSLRVRYPFDEVRYAGGTGRGTSRSDVRVRPDGTFGGGGDDSGRRVRVSTSGGGAQAWADLRVTVPAGRDVQVWGVVGDMAARDLDVRTLLLDTHAGGITATGVRGDFEADTGSGSVSVQRAAGSVEIDTGSGAVDLADVDGDRVFVDTGSGRVSGARLTASEVEVDTGSGDVDLQLVGPTVDRIEVDTGSGDVTLALPANLDAEIEADTGSGAIDVEFAVEVIRTSRTYFRGRIGDGRGSITIDTGSGRIRLIGN